jgi:hypothetical protein
MAGETYSHDEIYTPLTQDAVDQIMFEVAAAIDRMNGGMGFGPGDQPEPIRLMIEDIDLILMGLRDHQIEPPR